jgi:hypothetical protein
MWPDNNGGLVASRVAADKRIRVCGQGKNAFKSKGIFSRPFGTNLLGPIEPNLERLGYCQMSLRDEDF